MGGLTDRLHAHAHLHPDAQAHAEAHAQAQARAQAERVPNRTFRPPVMRSLSPVLSAHATPMGSPRGSKPCGAEHHTYASQSKWRQMYHVLISLFLKLKFNF